VSFSPNRHGAQFTAGNAAAASPANAVTRGSALPGPQSDQPGRVLKSIGVQPSKGLGQNFLTQPGVAAQIVNAARIGAGDTVVEIGPGLGILTELILSAGPQSLMLVELHRQLAATLAARFAGDVRIKVLNRDFLTLTHSELGGERLKVIGNLPFNIAAAILRHLSDYHDSIVRMVLMFQREVSERIRALPGARNYGSLSVFSSLYWQIIGHFHVAAGSFHPRPKVDAEVLTMEPRRQRDFTFAEEADVCATIRAAFSAPRKTIRNSLAGGLGVDSDAIERALELAGIDASLRPAMLDRSQLIALARILRPVTLPGCRA
jgi:16S rRNA (adenine1518-N6/adenine1519-N6)-dimethyltransferase